MNSTKVNRNDPCPCGSGKKYKQCCQTADAQKNISHATLLEKIPELFKRAVKYQQQNQLDKAEELYQQILTIQPKHNDTLSLLAMLFQKTDRIDMAVALFRKAVLFEPSAVNYTNLGQALSGEEAIEYTRKAIALNPGNMTAHNNLGLLFSRENQYNDAVLCFKKALSLDAKNEQALSNIGFCLMSQSQFKEAAIYLRQAIAINPHSELSHTRLLFCLCYDKDAFPDAYLTAAHQLNTMWQQGVTPYQQWQCPPISNTQPLRIGLVSGDLGNHPVGYFLESFIAYADKSKLEFFVYSTRAQLREDDLSHRIQSHVHQWQIIRSLTDQQAAAQIHHDGIHILIDLAGYTTNSGLSIFNWRPAPVQVSWLGYFASTGLQCMDYFLADPIAIPIENQSHFTEKVYYLPHTRLCFAPPNSSIEQTLSPLPALNNGFITFGCFQNMSKINDKMLTLWAKILQNCPNSQLLIKNNQLANAFVKAEFIARLNTFGITSHRLILEEGSPRDQYLMSYSRVDFMLDTFPYTGGTTTCEALWMGVPTLTLAGNTLLERQGAGFMTCVGLREWIAFDEDDYYQKAVFHARDFQKLNDTRAKLRETMRISPLVDANRFAKDMEVALTSMWQEKTALL